MQNIQKAYYAQEIDSVLQELDVSERGLNELEAKNRLLKNGYNELQEAKMDNYFLIFLRQFASSLIYILLVAGLVVLLMGEFMDAAIIFFVLCVNAVVGALQEGKAQNTFLALKKFIKSRATILRDGKEFLIPDREVVAGDVIILREGDKVPADGRLIYANALKVNEAALTGESIPKFKTTETLRKKNLSAANQRNMVFSGTAIVSGNGMAVVTATGENTFLGNIAKKTLEISSEFPLKSEIKKLSNFIIIFVSIVAIAMFALGIIRGDSLVEIFKTVVAMAVSVIPEGLPIVMTLVLAGGVWRMSKKHVLVKKLQAVEVLGETKVLAVDKTGTVTKNELIVEEVYSGGRVFEVTGSGYNPEGKIKAGQKVIEPKEVSEIIEAGKIAALAGNAGVIFDRRKSTWRISGDPTEGAMSVFSMKAGFVREELLLRMPIIDEIPFDYELKLHASLHSMKSKKLLIVTGSPETILARSSREWNNGDILKMTPKRKRELLAVLSSMSQKGLRVIGFASSEVAAEKLDRENLPSLVFGGFFGIKDTLRAEVNEAVKQLKRSGIKVVMITGDNEITAKSIAKDAGIYKNGDEILSGHDLQRLSQRKLASIISKVSVFARVTPSDKLKIIKAYQANGIVIAMTGDGVNDALSLTAADIGIGMGKNGTEVAKESSDIVLLNDNFGNIIHGVCEGRNIFITIKKVILFLFSTSVGEVFSILLALFLGMPLPILAAQILWLNLVTDGFLDLALAMERNDKEEIGYRKKTFIVDKVMIQRMLLMAVPMAFGTVYLFSRYYEADIVKAWTISLTTLATFQWFNAWNCKHETKSIFQQNPFSNKYLASVTFIVISLHFLALYNPFMQKILKTVPLTIEDWGRIMLVAISIIVVEEIRKAYVRICKSPIKTTS